MAHNRDHQDDDIPSIDYRIRGFFNLRTPTEMRELLKSFLDETGLTNEGDIFGKAMYLSQHPKAFDIASRPPEPGAQITDDQRIMLDWDADPVWSLSTRQPTRGFQLAWPDFDKWRGIPTTLLRIVSVCAVGAMVQGMDQAAVNGAQGLYLPAFKIYIDDQSSTSELGRAGLINAAPYLCCVVSCWFTPVLNRFLGRRGTIFWCALLSIVFAFAQALVQTWQQLFAIRLLLGLGIGPKSATIPIYAAEAAPANIRGSLVTCWQAFTALGIAIGSVLSPVVRNWGAINNSDVCPVDRKNALDDPRKMLDFTCSWNWRVILASPMFLPALLAFSVYFCHESPRWTVYKAHRLQRQCQPTRARYYYQKAFRDLEALSRDRLLAARDMFSYFYLLRREYEVSQDLRDNPYRLWFGSKLTQVFGKKQRRVRRSVTASLICMLAQQFCGVNIFIYYSNSIIEQNLFGKYSRQEAGARALWFTMAFGLINFVFALPAFLLVDMLGRRTLLLTTFPFLVLSHGFAALSSIAPSGDRVRSGLFLTGFFLFSFFYSPGEGPVPFVYASESMPLYIREEGVGLVTSVNWLFNWLVAFTAPFMFSRRHLASGGTFSLYAVFCVILWILILLFVPETRLLSLEQLDNVFDKVGTREFARHSIEVLKYHFHLRRVHPGTLYLLNDDDASTDEEDIPMHRGIQRPSDRRVNLSRSRIRNEYQGIAVDSDHGHELHSRQQPSHQSGPSLNGSSEARVSPALSNQDTIDHANHGESRTPPHRRNSNLDLHELDF